MDNPPVSRFPEIPGYQIQKILGRGGMGRVYLATDTRLHRSVAIKTLVDSYDEECPIGPFRRSELE